ncbi:SRPBCC domain-containing protein, partial [Streptomyces sp. NPDC059744]|uniref:SRPBCC domain-containing protein n=1 Tax=Streptomyces sp. NPDC059744 TaxID=3346929 RepID=UPI003649164A
GGGGGGSGPTGARPGGAPHPVWAATGPGSRGDGEPVTRLSYTWHTLQPVHREMSGLMSDEAWAEAVKERSKVTFDIEPAEEAAMGVELTITHDGFDSPDSKMLEGVSGGWIMILSTLKTLLEGGRFVSDQGRDVSA